MGGILIVAAIAAAALLWADLANVFVWLCLAVLLVLIDRFCR